MPEIPANPALDEVARKQQELGEQLGFATFEAARQGLANKLDFETFEDLNDEIMTLDPGRGELYFAQMNEQDLALWDGLGEEEATARWGQPCTDPAAAVAVRTALNDIAGQRESTREALSGGQSARTELVTTPEGGRAVCKSAPDWHDAEDTRFLMDGEVLASAMADAIGAPIARVHRRDLGDGEVWIEYIEGSQDGVSDLMDTPEAVRIGLLDTLTGYRDRGDGLIVAQGHLIGFGSGGSWLDAELAAGSDIVPEPFLRERDTPMKHFVDDVGAGDDWRDDPPIDTAQLAAIRDRIQALRPQFEAAGRSAWLKYSLDVLEQISQRAAGRRTPR